MCTAGGRVGKEWVGLKWLNERDLCQAADAQPWAVMGAVAANQAVLHPPAELNKNNPRGEWSSDK